MFTIHTLKPLQTIQLERITMRRRLHQSVKYPQTWVCKKLEHGWIRPRRCLCTSLDTVHVCEGFPLANKTSEHTSRDISWTSSSLQMIVLGWCLLFEAQYHWSLHWWQQHYFVQISQIGPSGQRRLVLIPETETESHVAHLAETFHFAEDESGALQEECWIFVCLCFCRPHLCPLSPEIEAEIFSDSVLEITINILF